MQTYITLNDSTIIPQFGLGVYQVPEGEATYNTVLDALKMGVRHIDTAHAYQKERCVGKAVKDSGVPREEVWITTKLWPHEYGAGKTAAAIDKMLDRLGTDYIDLLLLHQQFGDYLGAWKDMEKAVKVKYRPRNTALKQYKTLTATAVPYLIRQRSTAQIFRESGIMS